MTNKFKTTSDSGMIPGEGGGTGGTRDGRDAGREGRWTGGAYAVRGTCGTRDQSGYFTGTRLTS